MVKMFQHNVKEWAVLLAAATGMVVSGAALAADKYRVAVGGVVVSPSIGAKAADTVMKTSLVTDIETVLSEGGKFEVPVRKSSSLEAVLREQEFAVSDMAAKTGAAQAGGMFVAQSIIELEVQQFSFGRSAKAVPNLEGKYRISDHASIGLLVRLIDTTKGTLNKTFRVKASQSTPQQMANGIGSPSTALLEKVIKQAASDVANQVADDLFPMTVLSVKGKRIWVNRRNDSGIKMGERFIVFEPGEELKDPVTGEDLGSAESEVAEAKVVRINPKNTVLELTKGDIEYVQTGFILRRPQS